MAFTTAPAPSRTLPCTLPVQFDSLLAEGDTCYLLGTHLLTQEPVRVSYYTPTNAQSVAQRRPISQMAKECRPGGVVVFESAYRQPDASYQARWGQVYLPDPDRGHVLDRLVSIRHGTSSKTGKPWVRCDILGSPEYHLVVPGQDLSSLGDVLLKSLQRVSSRSQVSAFALVRTWDDAGASYTGRYNYNPNAEGDAAAAFLSNFTKSPLWQWAQKESDNIAGIEVLPGISAYGAGRAREKPSARIEAKLAEMFPSYTDSNGDSRTSFRRCLVDLIHTDARGARFDTLFYGGHATEMRDNGVRPPAYHENHIPTEYSRQMAMQQDFEPEPERLS
jgi:hypothetical protein